MCWTLRTTSGGNPIGITGLAVMSRRGWRTWARGVRPVGISTTSCETSPTTICALAAASASLRAGATGHRPSRPPTHRPRRETDPCGRARERGPRRAGPVADGAATATETPASPLRSACSSASTRPLRGRSSSADQPERRSSLPASSVKAECRRRGAGAADGELRGPAGRARRPGVVQLPRGVQRGDQYQLHDGARTRRSR